jgi:Leucine-rich repeat (LRR) protein
MTIHHIAQQQRIDAKLGFDWDQLPAAVTQLTEVSSSTLTLRLRREGKSYRGISRLQQLKQVWAYDVDQAYIDELCELTSLESLYLERVTATDLAPLAALTHLSRLMVVGATKINDLNWVSQHHSLRALALENFRQVSDLQPLASLSGLAALAVEGSMWTAMRIATLQPLANLMQLESLFLTNLRVQDRSLQPLHGLRKLRVLQCAKFYPREEFTKLQLALPALQCDWFDATRWQRS